MTNHPHTDDVPRQAPEGVDVRRAVQVLVVSVVAIILSVGVAWWLLPFSPTRTRAPTWSPEPVSGVEQGRAGRAARGQREAARARRALERYGWLDRDRGLARIPVDEAMDLLVDRGRTLRLEAAVPEERAIQPERSP